MFKVLEKSTFTHDVPVLVPVDGGHEEQTLKTTFNYLDFEQIAPFDLKTPEGTTAMLLAIVNCLHELQDEKGNTLPYTGELRDMLFRRQYVRQALIGHYLAAVTKAKEGN
jgi:hypothetical protein